MLVSSLEAEGVRKDELVDDMSAVSEKGLSRFVRWLRERAQE